MSPSTNLNAIEIAMTAGFHPLTVLDVRRETEDAVSVRLQPPPAAADAFRFAPGQHLTLRAEIGGEEFRRNYSICAGADEGLRVAIKRVEGGAFSSWALAELKPGDVIEAMPPHGSFTWTFEPGVKHTYLAIAGGSGVTPILSILKTGLKIETESRFVLLYGNRASNSVMLLEEIAALKDRYMSRLQIYHFLSAEADDIELFNGRLDTGRLQRALEGLIDPEEIDVSFICGPDAMMATAETALKASGVRPERVLSERFTASRPAEGDAVANRALEARAAGLEVEVKLEGRRRRIRFDPERNNILDSARAAGMPAPYACKAGVCATCRAKLISGKVQMKANYGLSQEEVAAGYVLTCQSVPLGEGVTLDYDA